MRAKLMEKAGKRSAMFAACAICAALLGGCTTAPVNGWNEANSWNYRSSPTYFTVVVRAGDTMSSIAARYDTSTEEVARLSDKSTSATLYPGDVLHVPANGQTRHAVMTEATNEHAAYAPATEKDRRIAAADPAVAPGAVRPSDITPRYKPSYATPPAIQSGERLSADVGNGQFCAPVSGRIIEGFGNIGNGQRNDGINLAAPAGAPIHAAADGTVSYAGNELKGYGNLILIKHDDGFVTAYAHANSIGVARGQRVAKGDVIGTVGQTGDVDQPQLHFELRQGMKPIDPRPLIVASAS